VNDGSPDNYRDIVLKWAEKDSRIKLLDKPNGGCASARQYGLERARGKYVGFVDPDDFVDESMFRKLLKKAMVGSYDISYCGYNEFYDDTGKIRRIEDCLGWPYCDGTTDIRSIRNLMMYSRVAIWRCIFKKEMLEKANVHFYTDLKRFDDLPFKAEAISAARWVISVQEYLYYYRLERPGQDVAADDERLYVHFDIFKHLNESIAAQDNAELTDCLQMLKVQTHIYGFDKIRAEFKSYYAQQAKLDLNTTGEFKRTYKLLCNRLGRANAEKYKIIIKCKNDKV
jgi:glycosyltransferase involved in cell wall biosynthesis